MTEYGTFLAQLKLCPFKTTPGRVFQQPVKPCPDTRQSVAPLKGLGVLYAAHPGLRCASSWARLSRAYGAGSLRGAQLSGVRSCAQPIRRCAQRADLSAAEAASG